MLNLYHLFYYQGEHINKYIRENRKDNPLN